MLPSPFPPNLQHYLTAHLSGARAATAMLASLADRLEAEDLRAIVAELEDEQDQLRDVAADLDLRPSTLTQLTARAVEQVSRTARRASQLYRPGLRDLGELESMITGISGKLAMWRLFRSLPDDVPALAGLPLEQLIEQGERQLQVVDRHRLAVGRQVLRQGR